MLGNLLAFRAVPPNDLARSFAICDVEAQMALVGTEAPGCAAQLQPARRELNGWIPLTDGFNPFECLESVEGKLTQGNFRIEPQGGLQCFGSQNAFHTIVKPYAEIGNFFGCKRHPRCHRM